MDKFDNTATPKLGAQPTNSQTSIHVFSAQLTQICDS